MKETLKSKGLKIINQLNPNITLGFGTIGRAYERSEGHRFNEGDVLIASKFSKNRDGLWFGYGGRPVAVVIAYEKGKEDCGKDRYGYRVTMYFDQKDDGNGNTVRKQKEEKHFKWNIENQFKKVPKGFTPEQALGLYKIKK
jgi:hypothetical protein